MEKVLFREEQRFRQWWMWLLIISAFTVPIVILGVELGTGTNNGVDETNTLIAILCVCVIIELAVAWLLWTSRLLIEIVEDGIRFRFLPFIRKWKHIHKSEIATYKVRQYNPIVEYGGWGMKVGRRGSGKAFNVSGKIGLQLYFKNGKKLLLGTQKKQAMQHALNKVFADDEPVKFIENDSANKKKQLFGGKIRKFLIIILMEIAVIILIFSLIQIFK